MTERVMKKSNYNETVPFPHPHPGERKWLLYNFFTERFLTLSDEEKALFDAFRRRNCRMDSGKGWRRTAF